jgi:RNA polymerase sigma factor (sigma-70 family)
LTLAPREAAARLKELSDEQLLALIHADKDSPAWTVLADRYQKRIATIITWFRRHAGLKRQDHEEAREEAMAILVEVVREYGPVQGQALPLLPFDETLQPRLWHGLRRLLHRLRRDWEHCDTTLTPEQAVEAGLAQPVRTVAAAASGTLHLDDPVEALLWRELWAELTRAKQRLPARERKLVDARLEGTTLVQAARRARLSQRAAERSLRRALAWLRLQMRDWPPSGS